MRILDKKAPRFGKGDFIKNLISKEALYKRFIQQHPQYANIPWDKMLKIWIEITKEIRNEVINNPLGIKLKYYIGELKLQYVPYKLETLLGDTQEKTLNLHSRGKTGILKWERREAVRYNKWLQFFAYDAPRETRDMACDAIMNNPEIYRTSRVTLGGRRIL